MNSQSNEYPSIIQKLDKNTFAFNYNVQEQVNENDEVYYTYEQTIINDRDLTHNKILRDTINEKFDTDQQLKLVNDYISYNLNILTDEKYKTRYEDFLSFRAFIKNKIDSLIL